MSSSAPPQHPGRPAAPPADLPDDASYTPSVGLNVVHLFFHLTEGTDAARIQAAFDTAESSATQVVCAAILGHKADLCVMALGPDARVLRRLQSDLVMADMVLSDSYVSLTEISEYAAGVPDAMKQARLYPQLPPEGKRAFCFYPMSKRRDPDANWFTLPYSKRLELMMEHGKSGRNFAGRVLQVVSGSTGVDAYEWGVTLFAQRPDDLKEVVYTMRFDRASAVYGDFGDFYFGYVGTLAETLGTLPGFEAT